MIWLLTESVYRDPVKAWVDVIQCVDDLKQTNYTTEDGLQIDMTEFIEILQSELFVRLYTPDGDTAELWGVELVEE